MKRVGLEKARKRLAEGFEALERAARATTWQAFESGWTQFLSAINATYNILGASCRGDARSEGWFSRIQGQRRDDDLLSYLLHARNSNDHGVDSVLEHQPGGIGIGRGASEAFIEELIIENGVIKSLRGTQDGGPLRIDLIPDRIELRPVVDRGVTYQPPRSFLGKPVTNRSPTAVGKIALEFVSRLFSEAEELVADGGN